MQKTPKGSQIHIGLFGKCNVGKSTLMNRLLGQELAIVSPVVGTTTDSVEKSIEWHPLGPIVVVDTAGIDDQSALGSLRVAKTTRLLDEIDFCLWVLDDCVSEEEVKWIHRMRAEKIPYLLIYNQKEEQTPHHELLQGLGEIETIDLIKAPSLVDLKDKVSRLMKETEEKLCIGDKLKEGDFIVLVAPQDPQAPKGRLILPEARVAREALDQKAIPIMTTLDTFEQTLQMLKEPPVWVVTDSQVFKQVSERVPKETKLTSFSILMARVKGDLEAYEEGLKAIPTLQPNDCVLIAESCTHNPLHEDIAREKIPNRLQQKLGFNLRFEWASGRSFPEDLSPYAMVIQCGGCMHTAKQIQNRIKQAKRQGIPITNFGVLLAYLSGTKWDSLEN